jgi:hypothetical protein
MDKFFYRRIYMQCRIWLQSPRGEISMLGSIYG